MTNLDRLKGTGLLVDGFESLLKTWLAPAEPNPEPLAWRAGVMKMLDALPKVVRQFYEMAQRWPQAGIQRESGARQLIFPPLGPEGSTRFLALVKEWDSDGQVLMSMTPDTRGKLYTDYDPALGALPEGAEQEVKTPVDEYLVTFAMQKLVSRYRLRDDLLREEKFAESQRIFTGACQVYEPSEFHFHPEGLLWAAYHGNPWHCASPKALTIKP